MMNIKLHVSAYSGHHQVFIRKSISVYSVYINTDTLSDENLMMVGLGRNM
jgi:hypothetical protein